MILLTFSLTQSSSPSIRDKLRHSFPPLLTHHHLEMTSDPQPHFVIVPLMAQGHTIPMVDMARLLASRGTTVTFITTPVNAARIKPIIDNVKQSGLPINFVELTFPCAQAGLPEGSENMDLLFSPESFRTFFDVTRLLREPLTVYFQNNHHPAPTCMISDYCHPWTMHVSRELNIPRLVFHGPCCFYILAFHNMNQHKIYDRITDVNEPFVLPDLPPYQFTVTKAQVPGFLNVWEDLFVQATEAEATSDGVVLNSFDELEPLFIDKYRTAIQKPVWAVGPMSLYNKDTTSKATRGNKASIDEHWVLGWLDSMKLRSVIYINFGSLVLTSPVQLMELGSGLEASGYSFVWVVKELEFTAEMEKWLEGFEERTGKRGIVIKGWAPQVVILSHPAVGGFVTHCGWNSILEAVAAGVPMITWPHFGDQFLNEKLVVDVLRVGITLGVTVPSFRQNEDKGLAVTKDDMEKALVRFMDGEQEGEEIRERARDFGEKARNAMELGGSSYKNLTDLIQYVSKQRESKLAGTKV